MQVLSETFPTLVLIKMGTAVLLVVLLSFVAEVVGTRLAGILSGYPLGAALTLFFIGYDLSPEFAAESAPFTCLGLIATQVFAYCYYRGSLLAERHGKALQILCATMGGLAGYFLAASVLQGVRVNLFLALLLPILAIALFHHLLRSVADSEIQSRTRMNLKVVLFRAFFAGCVIVLITFTAKAVGPSWAGLFAAFPMTVLPVLVIIHFTYDAGHVHAILKNFPKGLGALIAYSLAVALCYPGYGIYVGTAVAYGVATLYLVLLHAGECIGRAVKR